MLEEFTSFIEKMMALVGRDPKSLLIVILVLFGGYVVWVINERTDEHLKDMREWATSREQPSVVIAEPEE